MCCSAKSTLQENSLSPSRENHCLLHPGIALTACLSILGNGLKTVLLILRSATRGNHLGRYCITRYLIVTPPTCHILKCFVQGIYVGYRSYDKLSVEPLFPFGFGLSYTTFSYNDLETTSVSPDGTFSVSFTITNTGNFDGSESAQVYISDPASALPRPVKELKGFTKVTLKAGESTKASVALDREALGYFDERRKAWVAEKGVFEVLVGASSRDIRLKSEVELKETFTWTGL